MKINFTDKEIINIKRIIEKYRIVSHNLEDYQEKADKIQNKVIELNSELLEIKDEEDDLMNHLHKKYGDFTIQDVYYSINNGE